MGRVRSELDDIVEALRNVGPLTEGAWLAVDEKDEPMLPERVEPVGPRDHHVLAVSLDPEILGMVWRHREEIISENTHLDGFELP